jgi:hypothetical protein
MQLAKQLNKNLLDLAWSLWTELGVAGIKQSHKNVLIFIEELVVFTSIIAEIDPRLRDESMDWCSQYHHFISISRLKSLIKDFDESDKKSFSKYASSLNRISKANWPVFSDISPLKINLSHKSTLRPHASPALLSIRARSIFGTGARADLVAFFLVRPDTNFSIAEIEMGYTKRNLAEVLNDLSLGKLFDKFMQGNQQRYRLNKNSPLFQMLSPIPEHAPRWNILFKVLLALRDCIYRTENSAESTKIVEIRSCLKDHRESLQKLGISPPAFSNNFAEYLENFSQWILEWTDRLAKGWENTERRRYAREGTRTPTRNPTTTSK